MIVFLVGPTAVGKSEIALRLAEADGGAILSLDAMQVYRGLNIGTGKPTPGELARVPHGGLDLIPWWERFDSARYREAAQDFLSKRASLPESPIYGVGGTGLYFRILTQGLCEAPAASPQLRTELQALSLGELQERLRIVDPGQEQEVGFDWQNPRRVQRALEVFESTGIPLRQWHRQPASPPLTPHYRAFFLMRERDDIRQKIENRIDSMLRGGWIEETRQLIAERGEEAVRQIPAIGYRSLAEWLEKGGDFISVRQQIVQDTTHYAKRQLTWFKRELTVLPLMIPSAEPSGTTADRIRSLIRTPLASLS